MMDRRENTPGALVSLWPALALGKQRLFLSRLARLTAYLLHSLLAPSSSHSQTASPTLCHLLSSDFLSCCHPLSRPRTCVCRVALVASAAVGDQLQLPVESIQTRAGKGEIWLSLSGKSHSCHFPCHIPGAQGSTQVHLAEGEGQQG